MFVTDLTRKIGLAAAAALFAAALLFVTGCGGTEPPALGVVLVGGVDTVDSVLAANRGRWVMVNLWATWCRPCVAETPDLVEFANNLKTAPLTLLGVSADYFVADDTTAVRKVRDFQAAQRIPYANIVFMGTPDDLTGRFNVGGVLPTTILINPAGETVRQTVGILGDADFDTARVLIRN